jgi:hypothetical protein
MGNAIENVEQAISNAENVQRRFSGDPGEIDRLMGQILEPLREAELELSRSYQSLVEKDKIRAALEDEIPAAFQKEVKAYLEAAGKGK